MDVVGGNGEHEGPVRQRTANDKHVEIVQYLKQLPSNSRVRKPTVNIIYIP